MIEHNCHRLRMVVLGFLLSLSLCGMFGLVQVWGGRIQEELTAKMILNEAIQEVHMHSDMDLLWLEAEFVIRLNQLGEVKRARDLMKQVLAKTKDQITKESQYYGVPGFVERAASSIGMVYEFQALVDDFVALVQQRKDIFLAQYRGDSASIALIQLDENIQLTTLYWQKGDLTRFRLARNRMLQQFQGAYWFPVLEFLIAADILARTGHDEEALQVLRAYESAYDRLPMTKESPYKHWMFRVTNLADLANVQAESGNRDKARETLQRAWDKVNNLPISQLDKVYGIGDTIQSVGFRGIAWAASKIGDAALAKKAQASITNDAYDTVPDMVIQVLAKTGDMEEAENLVTKKQCCWSGIALGLAEKGDWVGAVQADHASWPFPVDKKFYANINKTYYYQKLGEARVHSQGVQSALQWARVLKEQPYYGPQYKVSALLGIVDGLVSLRKIEGKGIGIK